MIDSTHEKARQLAREFKIGITFLAVLFCIFIGVVYRRYRMSFVEPQTKFVAQTTQPDSATTAPVTGQHADLRSSFSQEIPDSENLDGSPTFRNPRDHAIQPPPTVLPPPSDFRARSPVRDAPSTNEVSGGSFQPIASSENDRVAVEEAFISPSRPSGETFAPAPNLTPASAPEVNSPTTLQLAPPVLTEPAAFEEHPEAVQAVRRTQFQESAVQGQRLDAAHEPSSEPPMTLAIDSSSKPIDQSTRVEPIRVGDSFWLIAQRAYGNGGYFRALYEHNRERFPEPDQLPVGARVEIPSTANLRQRFPEFCPMASEESVASDRASETSDSVRFYTVVGGESLFDVARFQLGQGSRYVEILQLNRDALDGTRETLPAGLRLRLPPR